jgi:hypothetical protein
LPHEIRIVSDEGKDAPDVVKTFQRSLTNLSQQTEK